MRNDLRTPVKCLARMKTLWSLTAVVASLLYGFRGVTGFTTRSMRLPPTNVESIQAASIHDSAKDIEDASEKELGRRLWLERAVGLILLTTATTTFSPVESAWASGGATAGKYTTIPIAKRRYYGRVQQGVHEFLLMGPDVVKLDMTANSIQHFFDPEGALLVPARRQDVNGQCTKKDNSCKGKEIRDSRYNDMKASMYLLGNAFRTDQQKPPDRLPTVKAAKGFFKEMNEMEKLVRQKPQSNDPIAAGHYLAALDILDRYLDLVELPPTESGHYDQEFDTLVGQTARIT